MNSPPVTSAMGCVLPQPQTLRTKFVIDTRASRDTVDDITLHPAGVLALLIAEKNFRSSQFASDWKCPLGLSQRSRKRLIILRQR